MLQIAAYAATSCKLYAESGGRRPQRISVDTGPGMEQSRGEILKDGHGLDANELVKMEQKKRKVDGSSARLAHAPDQMSVESHDSAQIARFPTSVSMDVAGSGTVNS